MDAAIPPITRSFSYKAFFDHGGTVSKMELEYMTTGFYVKAQRKGISIGRVNLVRKDINVFHVKREAFVQFKPASQSYSKHIIFLFSCLHQVSVDIGW